MANDILGSELNISGLEDGIARIEKKMTALSANMTRNSNNIIKAFQDISSQGVDALVNKLTNLETTLSKIGSANGFERISAQATSAIDSVVALTNATTILSKGETVSYKSGAVAKIEYQIDEKIKQLAKIQEQLNYYVKGEGSKAVGFGVNTSKLQAEADLLMKEISLLETKLSKNKEISQAKGEQIAKDKANTDAWIAMEKERQKTIEASAKASSEAAKANSKAVQEAYRDKERMYRGLWNEADKRDAKQQAKAEVDRYKEWLQTKHLEEMQHKRIEQQKTEATRSAIAEQNKMFAEQARRRQEGLTSNQAVKDSASKARQEYEQTLRMYDAMFAEIERREINSNAKRAAEAKRTTNAKIAEYERLMREERRLKADYKIASKASSEGLDYNNSKQATADELNKVVRERESLEIELGEKVSHIRQKYRAKDLKDELDAIEKSKKEREKAAREQASKQTARRTRVTDEWNTSSPDRAMNFSQNTQSINDQIKAIQYLKQVRDSLNKGSFSSEEEYRKKIQQLNEEIKRQQTEVDKLRGKQEQLKNSKKNLMDTMGQLQRKLALLFSVSAIQGYIQKMAQVRAEFELNQRSLQAILQNKEKADELWGQTIQLALKSPFRVKELVGYTKQLAAYRIESDKLYDTNKRLADVSAGLGVDMQRLILAYGQVRAAEYLRGTELRQFTEAGIPMLDELARYFTEVEGHAVSTADVFQRISKRMVNFADVEEVFRRLTNAGGVFYEMQEKQAETLKGQISNLHDAIDLMLNDIGTANDGTLKSLVSIARAVIDNWEEVWLRLREVLLILGYFGAKALFVKFLATETGKTAAAAYSGTVAYTNWGQAINATGMKIAALGAKLKGFFATMKSGGKAFALNFKTWESFKTFVSGSLLKGLNLARAGFAALKVTMSSFLPMLAITALVELYYQLTESSRAAERLQEELNEIESETLGDMDKSISNLRTLIAATQDHTKSLKERQDALSAIKREYQDILPDYLLEVDRLSLVGTEYEKLTKTISAHYDAIALKKKEAKIQEEYQDDIDSAVKNAAADMFEDLSVIEGVDVVHIERAINQVVEKVKAGEIEMYDFNRSVKDSIARMFGFTVREIDNLLSRNDISNHLRDVSKVMEDYSDEISNLRGITGNLTVAEEEHLKKMRRLQKEFDKQKKAVDNIKISYQELSKVSKRTIGVNVNPKDLDLQEKLEKEIERQYDELGIELPVNVDLSTLAASGEAISQEIGRIAQQAGVNLLNDLNLRELSVNFYDWSKNLFSAAGGVQKLGETTQSASNAFPKFTAQIDNYKAEVAGADLASQQFAESLGSYVKEMQGTDIQRYTNDVISYVSKTKNIAEGFFDFMRASADDSMASMDKKVSEGFTAILDNVIRAKTYLATNTPLRIDIVPMLGQFNLTEEQWNALNGLNKEEAEKLKTFIQAFFGGGKTNTGSGSKRSSRKRQENPAKDFAKVLEDMYKSYQDFNKKLGEDDSYDRVIKNWTKAFNEAKKKMGNFGFDLKDFDFTSIEGLTVALEKLKKTPQGSKIATDIENTLAGLTDDRDFKIEKKREDARDREIDQLFEMYELYKELEKINIPTDWAKSFFNIDATSLADLRSNLEQMKAEGKFTGTDDKETYQKYLDKISEMEQKEQEERLKTYLQYARDAVGERAKIKLEELKKLSEIEQAFKPLETDTPEVKEQKEQAKKIAMQKVKDESAQATKKLEWEEFQKSDTFMSLFEDLDNASIALMDHTLEKIRNFKNEWADMPLEDVKAMTDKINQLENAIELAKNPFTAVKNIRKKVEEETGQKLKSPEELDTEGAALDAENERLNKEIASLEVIRSLKSENKNLDDDQIDVLNNLNISTGVTTDELDKQITQKKDLLAKNNKDIQNVNKQKQANKDITKAYNSQAEALKNIDKMANDVYDAFSEIWEVVGNDEMAKVWADMGMSIVSSVFQATALIMQLTGAKTAAEAFGKAMNSAMGIVGLIVMAVQIVAQVLSAAFKAHDDKKQKEIDEEIKSIERLEKELENLEERLEAVYSLGGVNKSMRQVQANIDTQIQSYEKMMRLEEEKKSTDKEQIDEWKENIEELREKRKELHKEMVESLGGNYDIRSVAREFVDAWIDAFKETGDGLKGLRDNFKDFFLNILLEQAVMQKVGSFFSDAMDYLNNTVLSDYIVTDAERKQTEGMFDEAMIKTDDYLNLLFGENGVLNKYIDDTDSSLSGLQQGIQGVTEETAQIIEAYLNSIRFYIAQDNQNLAKLVDTFTNVESPNPILNELRTQTELITSIRDLFRDVVRMGHPTYGGAFLKVAL